MADDLKTYSAPWEGHLVLACRKCQKKLKGDPDLRSLSKLKKTVKRANREHSDKSVHIVNTPCMDLCPKGGVTVCDPRQDSDRLFILRSEEDIERLYS